MPPARIPATQSRKVGPRGQDTQSNNNRFLQEVFTATNKYRGMHGCPPLKINDELNKVAQEWAENLRSRNVMEHRPNPKFGENIFLSGGMDVTGDLPVDMWYREINSYNFGKPDFSPNTGHFTQLIWKSTKEMGTGVARKADRTWVVCNYNPPGNIIGQFKDNVPRKKGKSSSKMSISGTGFNDERQRFFNEVFHATNKYRAIHGCPALKINNELNKIAQDWADNLRSRNAMEHRPNPKFGENIFLSGGMDVNGTLPVDLWYAEIISYDFDKAEFSPTSGHFTQLVWKACREMGTGLARKEDRTWVVCNYNPPGNIIGQFKENVPKKIKK